MSTSDQSETDREICRFLKISRDFTDQCLELPNAYNQQNHSIVNGEDRTCAIRSDEERKRKSRQNKHRLILPRLRSDRVTSVALLNKNSRSDQFLFPSLYTFMNVSPIFQARVPIEQTHSATRPLTQTAVIPSSKMAEVAGHITPIPGLQRYLWKDMYGNR